jgi:hypothetical protein
VAEGARLESVYTLTGIVGSNPTLSASFLTEVLPFAQDFGSRLGRREDASSSNPTLSASFLTEVLPFAQDFGSGTGPTLTSVKQRATVC